MVEYRLEEYKYAKIEIQTTINLQFKILSYLVTVSVAALALFFEENSRRLAVFAYLLIPGFFSFSGALWIDQVYRQMRLVSFVYDIEEKFMHEDTAFGWEHRIHKGDRVDGPSILYFCLCMGLFLGFPVATNFLVKKYGGVGISTALQAYKPMETIGWVMIACLCLYSVFYLLAIRKLSKRFTKPKSSKKEESISCFTGTTRKKSEQEKDIK